MVRMPYVVQSGLSPSMVLRWKTFYQSDPVRARNVDEGLWRRTQNPENAEQSGWRDESDARRRMLHYWYRFDVHDADLVLTDFYMYSTSAYPREELPHLTASVLTGLGDGVWEKVGQGLWVRGDLCCSVESNTPHPQDVLAGRKLPAGYATMDVTVTSLPAGAARSLSGLPWQVLAGGMRQKDRRGNPTISSDLSEIADLLPFHVETGCGISVESGLPALHNLHELYGVTDRRSNRFRLRAESDDVLPRLLRDPEHGFRAMTAMFASCFSATPGPAYESLRVLAHGGCVAGPIITNNFDLLAVRAGLAECYVRRFDQKVPAVSFDSQARSLLVIGSHADRRRVQARARALGLPVFFLDPEGFDEQGTFVPYPLEGVQDADVLCRQDATSGLRTLAEILGVGP